MRLPTPCHRSLTRVMRSFLEQCSHARGATQVPGALRGAGTAAPQVHLPAAAPHHRPQHADAAGRLRPPHARRGARAHHRRGRRPPSAPGRCAALPSAAVHCSATVTQRRTVCFASRGYLGRSKGPPYCCRAPLLFASAVCPDASGYAGSAAPPDPSAWSWSRGEVSTIVQTPEGGNASAAGFYHLWQQARECGEPAPGAATRFCMPHIASGLA